LCGGDDTFTRMTRPIYMRAMLHAYRVAKTHMVGCLIFSDYFPQKSPIISGSFADRVLQLNASYASSPHCMRGVPHSFVMHVAGRTLGM